MKDAVKIKDVTNYLETLAPLHLQESYDNAGLSTGDAQWPVTGILITLDCTEAVVEEAAANGSNLIVAHHPILFKGLKKLTGSNYVERTVIAAIKKEVAIYAAHTNLDNVRMGVNARFAQKLDLQDTAILRPRLDNLMKLETFIPKDNVEQVVQALHEAGAGHVGDYSHCSFRMDGIGTFRPGVGTHPHIGQIGKQEYVKEVKVEMLFPAFQRMKLLKVLHDTHPYEEPAYFIEELLHEHQDAGSGMIGVLAESMELPAFLECLKSRMSLKCVRYTSMQGKKIKKVAVCGGAGSFLLPDALKAGADAFVSADFKYHEFFDADGKIVIADIGHFESEVATKELLGEILSKKFTNFAVNFSRISTNPISYYT